MPNPLNYGFREACQRLVDAGIVLETEAVWVLSEWPVTIDRHIVYKEEWRLIDRPMIGYKEQYLAPSMAEVWRELSERHDNKVLIVSKSTWGTGRTIAGYDSIGYGSAGDEHSTNTNPTDALIDLLIWQRGRKL